MLTGSALTPYFFVLFQAFKKMYYNDRIDIKIFPLSIIVQYYYCSILYTI